MSETIANLPAVGHDVNFFSLDFTNTCWIRAFGTSHGTVVLFAQTNDQYLETGERVFQAICESLRVVDA